LPTFRIAEPAHQSGAHEEISVLLLATGPSGGTFMNA
jgi:hypothetical protein